MKRISYLQAGVAGGLTSIVLISLSYIGFKLMSLPFLPYDIFDWMARYLPGGLINFVIDSQVKLITSLHLGPTASTAKLVENGIAIFQFIVGGILFGLVLAWVGRRRPEALSTVGTVGGLIGAGFMIFIDATYRFPAAGVLISIIWVVIILTAWGTILGRMIHEIAPTTFEIKTHPSMATTGSPETAVASPATVIKPASPEIPAPPPALSRRQFLTLVGAGSVTILVTAAGLRLSEKPAGLPETGSPQPTEDISKITTSAGPAASPSQNVLAARFKPVTGTRSELTPTDQFYRIDINSDPPVIDGNTWRLQIDGLVDKPMTLSLPDITSRPSITQAVTMSCISNEIGGDLIGTALWTGVPFKDILAEVGLKPGANSILIEAVDGFYESVPMAEAMDGRTMLVYQMNGQPLPIEHGFPLRIYIPNHYGMKQPKWITSMKVEDHLGPGYWVDRGWSATAVAQTLSVIDAVATTEKDPTTGLVPVGGIAWAGARGISKVEVQVDNGPWEAAELRNPPLSPLTWVLWRYYWKATLGKHTLSVRAYDGQGVLQVIEPNPTFPSGATGIDMFHADF